MKSKNFYLISTSDKLSRMLMLVFTGIVLGTVIARVFYDILNPVIDILLGAIAVFSVLFTFYMFFTSSKKTSINIALFNDSISFIIKNDEKFLSKSDFLYSDIKKIEISPQTTLQNARLDEPDIDKYSLRAFGYKTNIELNNGEKYEFKDSKSDGILMYSPTYVYRMIDLKEHFPSLNIQFSNFASKLDNEDFSSQFAYYEKNKKCLPLFKNKRYIVSLLQYTLLFFLASFLITTIISIALKVSSNNYETVFIVSVDMLKTFAAVIIPMWALAFTIGYYGGKRNEEAQKVISELFK